jgi:hypothetical protein
LKVYQILHGKILREKNFIRGAFKVPEVVSCPFQSTGEGIYNSLSFFINVPENGDEPAILPRRNGLDMFQERPAKIPVAPVRPKRASDAAAPFPEKLAGLCICGPPPINRGSFAERTDTDDVSKFMVRMPVYATDLKAGRAYN